MFAKNEDVFLISTLTQKWFSAMEGDSIGNILVGHSYEKTMKFMGRSVFKWSFYVMSCKSFKANLSGDLSTHNCKTGKSRILIYK